jgi:hypothetical protein
MIDALIEQQEKPSGKNVLPWLLDVAVFENLSLSISAEILSVKSLPSIAVRAMTRHIFTEPDMKTYILTFGNVQRLLCHDKIFSSSTNVLIVSMLV